MSLKALRDLQFELKKRKSAMMELDYKKGLELPTIKWTINEGDILRRRKEVELEKLYRNAYLAWEGVYENPEFQRFGTAPVGKAFFSMYAPGPFVWKSHKSKKKECVKTTQVIPPEIMEHLDHKLLSTPMPTMIFRRFENLLPSEDKLDILVKALLGFSEPMGYTRGSNNKILNDSWTVNLRSTREESENIMMDAFLKGFGGQSEDSRKDDEEKMIGIDISDELKDILKVYTDAEEHLLRNEKSALEIVTSNMKRYIQAQDERKNVSNKLTILKEKLAHGESVRDEESDEYEDE